MELEILNFTYPKTEIGWKDTNTGKGSEERETLKYSR
jgi:hypothetical protein